MAAADNFVPFKSSFVYSRKYEKPMCRDAPTTRLRGLLPSLKSAFYSNRKFTEVKEAAAASGAPKTGGGGKLSPRRGRALGKRVDREMASFVHQASRRIDKTQKRHPYTQRLLRWLDKHQYRLAQCQVRAGTVEPALRLWTAADCILQDVTSPDRQDLVGGEIKVHCDDYYDTEVKDQKTGLVKMLKEPYNDISDTQCHRDQLQLAFTKYLFEQTHPTRKPVAWMVIRVHQTHNKKKIGVHIYPLEAWVQAPDRWSRALRALHPRKKK